MSVDNLRKILRRYDAGVDNGTYSRKIGGAVVAVTLCSCPERLIPKDIKREKPKNFAVTIARDGGLSESVILAPMSGAQVFEIWKASEARWESEDQVLKTRNEATVRVNRPGRNSASASAGFSRISFEYTSGSDNRLQSSSEFESGSQIDKTFSDLARRDTDTVTIRSQDEDGEGISYTAAVASHSVAGEYGRHELPEHIKVQFDRGDSAYHPPASTI